MGHMPTTSWVKLGCFLPAGFDCEPHSSTCCERTGWGWTKPYRTISGKHALMSCFRPWRPYDSVPLAESHTGYPRGFGRATIYASYRSGACATAVPTFGRDQSTDRHIGVGQKDEGVGIIANERGVVAVGDHVCSWFNTS